MAIKRFIPNKDSFIINGLIGKNLNVGKDELLELGYCDREGTEGSSRTLLSFDSSVSEFISTLSEYSSSLHLSITRAENLPEECNLELYKICSTWQEGFGRLNDIKITDKGVTWTNRKVNTPWQPGDIETEPFKVVKYTGKDLDINLGEDISKVLGEGVEIKLEDESLVDDFGTRIVFYGKDTHTIYQPYLNVEWDDSVRETTLEELTSSIKIVAQDLRNYTYGEEVQINLSIVDKAPARVFSTASIYRQNYVLPEESYWGIENTFTTETVIPFGFGTKLSANDNGNYFRLDSTLLEPERYYNLVVKVREELFRVGTFKVARSGRL